FLALRPPGSRIVANTVCPWRASVSAISLPKPVLAPVTSTTCFVSIAFPPDNGMANLLDAGGDAPGYTGSQRFTNANKRAPEASPGARKIAVLFGGIT